VSWLDFLLRPPGRDQFARLVIARLQRAGQNGQLKYDSEQFLIERGGDGFINLANLYHEYCQAPRQQRDKVLDRFIRGCVGTSEFELPEEFADVHPDLLPVVRSRFYLESVILQSRARGGEAVAVPQQLIGDHLSLSLVYDLPQAMRSIIQDDLDRWGVSFYEAAEAARENLEHMGNVSFASLQSEAGDGVYISANSDNYDASRLVLVDLVKKMAVRGEYVAMVPNRDTLVVTGSQDEAGLAVMCKVAEDSFRKPRPISTIALRLVGDQWDSWLPQVQSPVYDKFRELRIRTLGMEYNDQKELLDQVHQQSGYPCYVAAYSARLRKDSGRVRSYCVWTEGITALLPRTDDIGLMRPSHDGKSASVAAFASFERVRNEVGDLMQPQGMYPERYRVVEFPSEAQLAAIGREQEME
jgi:hypothetical protein